MFYISIQMKYQTMSIVIMGSILGIISLGMIALPVNTAEARFCYVQPNPYPNLPDEIKCLEFDISLPLQPSFCPQCSELNPQPLPPVVNLMISPGDLDSTQTLKITNIGNRTTLVNVVNATN